MAETFLYLTTIGRKTRNPHQIEIWYVPHGDAYYLCSEHPHKADWVKNLQVNPQVTFCIAEREQAHILQDAEAQVVQDSALKTILHEKFKSKYDWSNDFFVEIMPHSKATK